MAKGFTLAVMPWVYLAKYHKKTEKWDGEYIEKPHKSAEEEAAMSGEERDALLQQRNSFPELPIVNYTTQYGLGCFEGLKAFPQPDGSWKIFRPDKNAERMHTSMKGLKMPALPEQTFVDKVLELTKRNTELGFGPSYDPAWENNDFLDAESIYFRPFTYAEPSVGLGLCEEPWVVFVATPVGAYFKPGNHAGLVTDKTRATKNGTGWIKCDANYTISILAKKEAEAQGYMEALFLDGEEHSYVEEGSSSNIFFLMKDDTLVTPDLGDTILPGVTRASLLTLARNKGVKTEERKVSIEEAMSEAKECFVSGTAAGLSYIESITYNGETVEFRDRQMGELSRDLLVTLKGIQYGKIEDTHGWMYSVP